MTRDDIIRMAREAGFTDASFCRWSAYTDDLDRFAAIVAAAEREACAQVCDEIANRPSNVVLGVAINCADAIRARKEK